MSTATPQKTAAAPSRSWPLRIAGFVVGTALALATVVILIAVMADSLQPGGHPDLVGGVILVGLLGFVALAWKRVRLFGTWARVALGAVMAAGLLGWLMWDDRAYTHPLMLDEISPAAGATAAESHAVTLWYTPRDGHEARKFKSGPVYFKSSPGEKTAEWAEEITRSREAILAEWEAMAPEREWFAAMDAFPAIGDDVSGGFEAPIIRFEPYRRMVVIGQARAALLALDGRGDEAMDILIRQVSVAGKLERNSRTLVRSMIALTGLRQGVEVAKWVLERAPVSPAKRAELAAVLAQRDAAAAARRVVWVDFLIVRDTVLERGDGVDGLFLGEDRVLGFLQGPLRRLTVLPRNTANLASAHLAELEAAARARDLDRIEAAEMAWNGIFRRGGPKNFGGKYMFTVAMPSFKRVLESQWKYEDAAAALLAQLKG